LPTAALAGVFVLAIGIALFAVFAGKEETPEAPNVAPSTAEPAPSAAAPTAPTSPATASTTAPAAHPAATPAAPPIAAAPPPPPPKKAAAPSAPAAAAEPAPPPKTCDGVSGFSILLCRAEGPQRFWRCAPDGVNWDNDIPGCQRDTGNRNRIY
jgi:hypothetical protein